MTSTISGFHIIPVAYSSTATHYIYARIHTGSKKAGPSAALPEGRTLFIVNAPPDATEREFISFFKYAGTIERIVFPDDEVVEPPIDDSSSDEAASDEDDEDEDEDEGIQPRKKRKLAEERQPPPKVIPLPTTPLRTLRPTGRAAHIIFLDASSASRALQSSASQKPRPWPVSSTEPTGLEHYLALHAAQRLPLDAVRTHVDSYMERFDWEQAKARRASKYRKGEAVVDEDGFTLVTRGGAYGQTVGGGVGVASKKFQESAARGTVDGKRGKGRKKRESKSKEGFYAFQIHERKRNGAFGFAAGCFVVLISLKRIARFEEKVGRGQGKGRKVESITEVQALLNNTACPLPALFVAIAHCLPMEQSLQACRLISTSCTNTFEPPRILQSSSPRFHVH